MSTGNLSDVVDQVTELLHESHAPLLAAGHNFMAATQDAQLAVAPKYQKLGLGVKLLDLFEQEARAWQKRHLACDTAESASDLVAYYRRRGFSVVSTTQYPGATYKSVVLSRRIL